MFSVSRAFEHAGAQVEVTADPGRVGDADRLVVPGAGAFGDGIGELRSRGLVEPIRSHAAAGRALLGICLGMHLLMDEGDEFGSHEGLGLVPGHSVALPPDAEKVPHMDWSAIEPAASWKGSVLDGVEPSSAIYCSHSYAAESADESERLAETPFGAARFTAALRRGAISGAQFHPEKSGPVGLRVVENFVRAA